MSPPFPVIILAGGLATRLGPLTKQMPKALLEMNGESFISHQLKLLKKNGIREVICCLGYLGERIQHYLQDGHAFGLNIQYSFDGETLLGTGGAIKKALNLVDDHFFVLYGDSYLQCDYAAIQSAFLQQKKLGLMTVFANHGQWDTSNVEYRAGNILAYDKKNQTERMHYIDYGLGVFHKAAFADVQLNQPHDLASVYQALLSKNQLAGFQVTQRFYEIGSLAGIQAFEEHLKFAATARKKAVFLDRDGVLNETIVKNGKPYPPASVAELTIADDVLPALQMLKKAGFLLIVVTNQPDVARGKTALDTVCAINHELLNRLPLDDIHVCFHDDADHCDCRKPLPGLLIKAAEQYDIDLTQSIMIGDRWKDIEAGQRAGCKSIWLNHGYLEPAAKNPNFVTNSLLRAAEWVINNTTVS